MRSRATEPCTVILSIASTWGGVRQESTSIFLPVMFSSFSHLLLLGSEVFADVAIGKHSGYSPRFAWGGRPHRTFILVRNICACSLHLYFKKLRSHPQPAPSRPMISLPLGSFQWVFFSFFLPVGASQAREFQIAMTTTPRKTVQTTFCAAI